MATRNILFIMFDQLRWDYLSCAGHKTLHTPHIDRLASQGVRFTKCYVQSPVCGASRMSTYTGRYSSSHGAQWNGYPLRVGEMTLGDHLRANGMDCFLLGKTHMKADLEGMARLGIDPGSKIGRRQAECGFDAHIRDDGLWPNGPEGFYDPKPSPYNAYLKSKGYQEDNPWNMNANAGRDEDGSIASGWFMRHADKPANIREEDSETTWLTSETIDFIQNAAPDTPWCAHVSYIKPHWPYIVPAPYHALYGPDDVQPVNRSDSERVDPHPVYKTFHSNLIGRAFHRQEVRDKAIPAYMGLIKQCDDQMGRLFAWLEETGRMKDTVIVITSDHGDYLGDHWMGEKDLFHDCSAKVPLIIYDPSAEADATRGTTCDALVEQIDLTATFIEMAGGEVPSHLVEGRSLLPFLHGHKPEEWREVAISEYDYAVTPMRATLGVRDQDARLYMVTDGRWKLMHSEGPGHGAMLFDLVNDPGELTDLGRDPAYEAERARLYAHLHRWALRMNQRVTRSAADIAGMRGRSRRRGILLGVYDEHEVEDDLTRHLQGKAKEDFVSGR